MLARLLVALALLVAAAPLAAQTPPAPPAANPRVEITTSLGAITLELDQAHAPRTTANFLRYVDARRFDGTTFYRAMNLGQSAGLIQGGLRNAPGKLFPPVIHEPTSQTGLTHKAEGTISMAREAPGSATADFFITLGDLSSLDADPAKPGDNSGFAAFGHVVAGMDVVRQIMAAPVSPTEGTPAMKGQMLAPPVRIVSARRLK